MKYTAIRENHLYSKAYQKGKKAVCSTVAVYVLPDYRKHALMRARPDKTYINRVGLTVGKRIGGAVERNRAKRIIRHAYRHLDVTFGIKTGHLIVIAARDGIAGKKTADVTRDLRAAFKRLELL